MKRKLRIWEVRRPRQRTAKRKAREQELTDNEEVSSSNPTRSRKKVNDHIAPNVLKASQSVAISEAPTIQPKVSRAQPKVSRTQPAVSRAEPEVSRAEPAVSRAEPAEAPNLQDIRLMRIDVDLTENNADAVVKEEPVDALSATAAGADMDQVELREALRRIELKRNKAKADLDLEEFEVKAKLRKAASG